MLATWLPVANPQAVLEGLQDVRHWHIFSIRGSDEGERLQEPDDQYPPGQAYSPWVAKASLVTDFVPVNAIPISHGVSMPARYTVSDGQIVLNLESAEEGGYIVTAPLDPELITQAETLEEAFVNARDVAHALKQARAKR